jgi:hypothetical protein
MSNFRELQDRYLYGASVPDNRFKALVDALVAHMETANFTPQEMREAVYMACIKFAQTHVEPMFIRSNFAPEDADEILKYITRKLP